MKLPVYTSRRVLSEPLIQVNQTWCNPRLYELIRLLQRRFCSSICSRSQLWPYYHIIPTRQLYRPRHRIKCCDMIIKEHIMNTVSFKLFLYMRNVIQSRSLPSRMLILMFVYICGGQWAQPFAPLQRALWVSHTEITFSFNYHEQSIYISATPYSIRYAGWLQEFPVFLVWATSDRADPRHLRRSA